MPLSTHPNSLVRAGQRERHTFNGNEAQHSCKVGPSAVARRSQTNRPCMHVHHAHWQLLEFETEMRSGHMRQRARIATGRRPPPPCPRRPDPPHPIPPNPHFPCSTRTEMKCSVSTSTPATSNRVSQTMQYMMEGHGQPYRFGQTYTHTRWYRSRRPRAKCHIRTINSYIAHNRTRYGAAIWSAPRPETRNRQTGPLTSSIWDKHNTHTHSNTHTHANANTHTHTHTHTNKHTHSHTPTPPHAPTHPSPHTHTHTHK